MLKHFSDERQSNRKKPLRPCGLHPNAQEPRVWGPGLRRKSGVPSDRSMSLGWKSGHTSLPAVTISPEDSR